MRTKVSVVMALCWMLVASRAEASFHLTKIVQVFPGTPAAPAAQYIVLESYSAGQSFVSGQQIQVFNASGALIGMFAFSSNVSNGASQARILIGTTEAQTFFGVTVDLVMTAVLPAAGGKVCFSTVDCVAWGNYTGSATGVGTPWNGAPPSGLVPTRALVRRLDVSGGSTTLEAGDDTDNSLNDFVLATPVPVNNAGSVGAAPASTCSNGVVEGLEGCDDTNLTSGDGCSSGCVVEKCGDGIVNNHETCDDLNTVNGDGCDNNCTITACGNNILTTGETCDDGNPTSGDGCDSNCKPTGCGNGVVTSGETCDDSNLTSGDGCDVNCTATGCGNGVVTSGESCDPPNGTTCNGTCQQQCTMPSQCADTDPCTTNERCQGDNTCAVDQTPTDDSEPCTVDGCNAGGVFHTASADGTTCTLSAMPTARALCVAGVCGVAHCGDGYVDLAAPGGAEECDDGNAVNNDACSNACTVPACGDGIVQQGEECDDGNLTVDDGCSSACVTERCGDQLVQGTESCDDGNTIDDDGCSATCVTESCGDGVRQAIEQCDDGNADPNDGCTGACLIERCGDGSLQAGEECDDGNTVDGDRCSATCTKPGSGGCCDVSQDASLPLLLLAFAVLAMITRRRDSRYRRSAAGS